jgi:hypothetical protein
VVIAHGSGLSWLDQVPDKPAFGRLPISGRFV